MRGKDWRAISGLFVYMYTNIGQKYGIKKQFDPRPISCKCHENPVFSRLIVY